MNREMFAMCSFPFCERSAAVLMQPTFDRGRATWHDAHTMDPPFEARWTSTVRDQDRHHHGWRAPCNEWVQDLPEHEKISDSTSRCWDNALLDLRLSTTKLLMGSACLRRGGKTRASQRKLGATSTSTSHSSMRRRWSMKSQLRVRQASTNAMNCFQARCRTEGALASCR